MLNTQEVDQSLIKLSGGITIPPVAVKSKGVTRHSLIHEPIVGIHVSFLI